MAAVLVLCAASGRQLVVGGLLATEDPQGGADDALGGRHDGLLEVLDAFGTVGREGGTVHPLLVYADLVTSGNARNLEAARTVHSRFLAPRLGAIEP